MSAPVFEVAILARAVWNLHSLNNEGTVGNVSEPRTVVLWDGKKSDGISGEMLKHIHAQNVWLLAEDKSIFCQPCRTFQPQKADINPVVTTAIGKAGKGRKAEAALEAALNDCALCDLHGFLRTDQAVPRASTVEYGWAVAVRESYYRDIHLHARHAVEGRTMAQQLEGEGAAQQEGQVAAQMVYHRPTRSGEYAIVSVFQPWRIGLNEVNYQYVDGVDRIARYKLGLEAYEASFARTDGAMTSTRLPHAEGIKGVVMVSSRNFPVPVTSPLQDGYRETAKQLCTVSEGLDARVFNSLAELYVILSELSKGPLYTLQVGGPNKKGKK